MFGRIRKLFRRDTDGTIQSNITKIGGTALGGAITVTGEKTLLLDYAGALGAGALYTSAWFDLSDGVTARPNYKIVLVCDADTAGAANGIVVEQSATTGGAAVVRLRTVGQTAPAPGVPALVNHHQYAVIIDPCLRYARVLYTGVLAAVIYIHVEGRSLN